VETDLAPAAAEAAAAALDGARADAGRVGKYLARYREVRPARVTPRAGARAARAAPARAALGAPCIPTCSAQPDDPFSLTLPRWLLMLINAIGYVLRVRATSAVSRATGAEQARGHGGRARRGPGG